MCSHALYYFQGYTGVKVAQLICPIYPLLAYASLVYALLVLQSLN